MQWRAIKKHATSAREQVGKMQGQLDEMKRQADLTEKGLDETRKITAHNEQIVKAMHDQLVTMKVQAAATEAQMGIAEIAVRVAERSATATEKSVELVTQGSRPYLDINAILHMPPSQQSAVEVNFINSGNSDAIVSLEYAITITGPARYEKSATIEPFTVPPRKYESRRIEGVDASQVEAVVQDKARLVFRLTGRYTGVGGPFPIEFCKRWAKNRGIDFLSIAEPCDVTDAEGKEKTNH